MSDLINPAKRSFIRQDKQDKEEVSSVFPEERQKDFIHDQGNISRALVRAMKAHLAPKHRYFLEGNLSQFHPSGAEAPPGRRQETEKRSG